MLATVTIIKLFHTTVAIHLYRTKNIKAQRSQRSVLLIHTHALRLKKRTHQSTYNGNKYGHISYTHVVCIVRAEQEGLPQTSITLKT